MSEEISKEKFWIVGIMNGTLVIVQDEQGQPKRFGMKEAQREAKERAIQYGPGYYGVVLEHMYVERPYITTERIYSMSSSKIEAKDDDQQ